MTATTVAPTRATRRRPLDGVRAVAAVSVVVYHVCTTLGDAWLRTPAWDWILRLGAFGVCLFFVLSGFLLFRPWVEANFDEQPPPRLGAFWMRRLVRIFPAYWLAFTFYVVVLHIRDVQTVGAGATYFFLLQNYRGGYQLGALFVAWSLVVELSFYLVLPALGAGIRRLALATDTAGARIPCAGHVRRGSRGVLDRLPCVLPVDRGCAATAGGDVVPAGAGATVALRVSRLVRGRDVARVVGAWLRRGGRLHWILDELRTRPGISWLLAVQCYWVLTQLNLPAWWFVPSTNIQSFLAPVLTVATALLVIWPIALGDDRSRAARALGSGWLVWLGGVSYGIYLWHPVWIGLAETWSDEGSIPHTLVVWLPLVLAGSIVAAWISHRLLEAPLARWSHRRFPSTGVR